MQHNFTVEKVVARLNEILPYGPARDQMIEGLARVKASLRGPDSGQAHPAEQAAEAITALLQGERVVTRS